MIKKLNDEGKNKNGKKKKIQLNYEADNMFITSIKNGQMKVIDHRFNKMLVDGKLFVDMELTKRFCCVCMSISKCSFCVALNKFKNYEVAD